MDKLDLVLKAIDDSKRDNTERCDRLETMITEKFDKLNGRVRKNENDILRIKTVWGIAWAGATFLGGALWHFLVG